jgi:phenylacetate-CoA ligase
MKLKKFSGKNLRKSWSMFIINNEFYRNYFESVNLTPDDIKKPEDMLKLPIVEKKILRNYFEKIISKNVNKDDHILSCTSGSSGEPFSFYLDTIRETPNTYMSFVLNKESLGIQPFKKINEIIIKANPINEVKDLKRKVQRSWSDYIKYLIFSEHIGIRSTNIQSKNANNIKKIIENNNIKGIYGVSSTILSLARYFSTINSKIDIKYIIAMGEGLLPQQKQYISKIFNCPVYMDYGASECIRTGFECKYQNGYHMDIYNYYFEFLKKDGDYAHNQETGEIVVTNLNNYVFPFIRYRVGDTAVVTDRMCKCGINYPLVEKISGRKADIIRTPNGIDIPVSLFAAIFEHFQEYVWQYQVINEGKGRLLVKIVPTENFNEKNRMDIEEQIYNLIDKSMKVEVIPVKEIAAEKSGKTKVAVLKN